MDAIIINIFNLMHIDFDYLYDITIKTIPCSIICYRYFYDSKTNIK